MTKEFDKGVPGRTPWQVVHAPAAAVQATIGQAAGGAAIRNHLVALQATLAAAVAPADAINVHVRDGGTGAGTIIWSGAIAAIADGMGVLSIQFDPPLRGTANTVLTVEFSAAGPAGSVETVNAQGYAA